MGEANETSGTCAAIGANDTFEAIEAFEAIAATEAIAAAETTDARSMFDHMLVQIDTRFLLVRVVA